jgi:hypothetical protein
MPPDREWLHVSVPRIFERNGASGNPKYKIHMPPFYAAWATPVLYDTYAEVRINMKRQVMDFFSGLSLHAFVTKLTY